MEFRATLCYGTMTGLTFPICPTVIIPMAITTDIGFKTGIYNNETNITSRQTVWKWRRRDVTGESVAYNY